uniref:Uncharacterized protein n=1 Tax=Anguilla anguilla TaxID=7936 RepID=A0A0E9U0S4_ANGAN
MNIMKIIIRRIRIIWVGTTFYDHAA